MKAAVFHTPQQFRIEEVPYPKVEPDGVIVKVKDCGICGSDLHFYNGGRQDGVIMGHEFSGDVVEVGAEVTGVKKGDRVVACRRPGLWPVLLVPERAICPLFPIEICRLCHSGGLCGVCGDAGFHCRRICRQTAQNGDAMRKGRRLNRWQWPGMR